ncbi:uncharacterized protein LOC143244223 [Tachypleus tridentatus]|uniref:uncharacterized protein LOC143244223 n=1 Tax=Tachypleus tridentatus TaxID=6853 RepID=UPI003FCFFEAC
MDRSSDYSVVIPQIYYPAMGWRMIPLIFRYLGKRKRTSVISRVNIIKFWRLLHLLGLIVYETVTTIRYCRIHLSGIYTGFVRNPSPFGLTRSRTYHMFRTTWLPEKT